MFAHDERRRIVDVCVDLSRRGHFAGTGGNLALRIDAGLFAVTPSATDYLAMTAEDVCIVRLADLAVVEGRRAPSVETGLHARVLRRRPDVRCTIHTHQPVASAWALLSEPLDTDDDTRPLLGPRVPLVGYMPSGTALLSRLVDRAVRADVNAYLMRNHGVICCGANVDGAIAAVDALERLARRRLAARIAARMQSQPRSQTTCRRVLAALETS
jgi:L-fuculose-phosphate aldolase